MSIKNIIFWLLLVMPAYAVYEIGFVKRELAVGIVFGIIIFLAEFALISNCLINRRIMTTFEVQFEGEKAGK